jgi:hypothetical protein
MADKAQIVALRESQTYFSGYRHVAVLTDAGESPGLFLSVQPGYRGGVQSWFSGLYGTRVNPFPPETGGETTVTAKM